MGRGAQKVARLPLPMLCQNERQLTRHIYACFPNVGSISLDILSYVCKQAEKIQAVCVYFPRGNFGGRGVFSFFLLVTGSGKCCFSDSEVFLISFSYKGSSIRLTLSRTSF